jgi:hypothetical protein
MSLLNDLIINNKHSLKVLEKLYFDLSISKHDFKKDKIYLENAFAGFSKLWLDNFDKIDRVKYILLAEAPLWGDSESYIYNGESPFTQFFYKSDLEKTLGIAIDCKKTFLNKLNEIGFLIIDISPFALNKNTKVNYSENYPDSKKLKSKLYKQLVSDTIPYYFNEKLMLAKTKINVKELDVIFRYKRVESAFQGTLLGPLKSQGFINEKSDFKNIWQNGGGIDIDKKFRPIII